MKSNNRHLRRVLLSTAILSPAAFCAPAMAAATPQKPCANMAYAFTNTTSLSPWAFMAENSSRSWSFNVSVSSSSADGTLPVTVDAKTFFKIAVTSNVPSTSSGGNNRSLTFSTPATADAADIPEKFVMSAVSHDSVYAATVNGPPVAHALSFDFMLASDYQNPVYWLLHMQAFQEGQTNPPMTFDTLASSDLTGPVTMAVHVRDDRSQAISTANPIQAGTFQVSRGVWHHADFLVVPSPDTTPTMGSVQLYLDGQSVVSYTGHWGYTVPSIPDTRIGFDFGIYRRLQNTSQAISFDNITYRDLGCSLN